MRRYSHHAVHPDRNNVGGPSHAAYTGLYPQRRAGVIPPIIKLLSCGWHPRATRGTKPGPPFSSRPHSPCSPCLPLLSLNSSSRPTILVRFLPPSSSYLSGSRRSSLIVRQEVRARFVMRARTHDSEQIAVSAEFLPAARFPFKNLSTFGKSCAKFFETKALISFLDVL